MTYCTHQLRYITHFIIVPADGIHQLVFTHGHYFGLGGIKQGTEVNADYIAAYNFVFIVTKAFIAGGFHGSVTGHE